MSHVVLVLVESINDYLHMLEHQGYELILAPTPASRAPGYNPDSPVQVLGAGPLSDQARARLTDEERGQLTL